MHPSDVYDLTVIVRCGPDEIRPSVDPDDGVPDCTQGECPQYDGKRCRIMGRRPSSICRPAVERLARRAAGAA